MTAASATHNLLIVSDLHLSEGRDPVSGKFSPREDFFFDHEFARFLRYHARLADEDAHYGGRRWRLLLNGDIFCFLQVLAKPRFYLYTFEEDAEGWKLNPNLAAGEHCSARNGGLQLDVSFDGVEQRKAAVWVDLEDTIDLSSYARLHARVWAPRGCQAAIATLRVRLDVEEGSETLERSLQLEAGGWSQVTLDLALSGDKQPRHARGVELILASSVAQAGTFCLDEIWADPVMTPREEQYGLGTTAEEVAWKLRVSAAHHAPFFQALARFLAQGHQVAYIKGNHDVDMHWPVVQDTFRDLVVEAGWQCADLSADDEQIRQNIDFHPWIYYEPGVIYVEHGNQYEPANFFRDFLNPVLPEDPLRLELPLGSLFVRYVFNALEGIHPWADNVKPSTAYLEWAFRRDLLNTLGIVVDNLGLVLRAIWQAFRKRAVVPKIDPSVLEELRGRCAMHDLPADAMREIAELTLQRVAGWWRRVLRSAFLGGLSFLLLLGVIGLLLQPIVDVLRLGFGRLPWLSAATQVGIAILLFVLRRFVQRGLARETEHHYLQRMAERVAVILTRHHAAVPYLVFGHTHNADVVKLTRSPELPFDQWYVNTGTWVQVFSDEERLIRDRKQFSYFVVVPGETPQRPALWHWKDDANRPAPVLMLDGDT